MSRHDNIGEMSSESEYDVDSYLEHVTTNDGELRTIKRIEDNNSSRRQKEEEECEQTVAIELNRDTFSFIFVSPVFSKPFGLAIFIFVIQIVMFLMAALDILQTRKRGNLLGIPVYTDIEVVVAQAIALFVVILVNRDITESIDVITVNYDSRVKDKIPSATHKKWVLSNLLRSIQCILGLIVTLLFIFQSDDVLKLFLDFTAIQFVTELDSFAFIIGDNGYLVYFVTRDAIRAVKEVRMELEENSKIFCKSSKFRMPRFLLKPIFVLSLYTIFYGSWAVVRVHQFNGLYYNAECQVYLVNFDNNIAFNSSLRYESFTGVYTTILEDGSKKEFHGNRPVYYQRGRKYFDKKPAGKISYCKSEGAWVFTIEGVHKKENSQFQNEKCDWLLKSRKTESYILDDVPEIDWIVWTGTIKETILDITCTECFDTDLDVEDCNFRGKCVQEQCYCDPDWMGNYCQICISCSEVNLSANHIFPLDGINMTRLDLNGKPANAYNRPIYFYNDFQGNETYILLYGGGEYYIWNIQRNDVVMDKDGTPSTESVRQYVDRFHSAWSLTEEEVPIFRSDPTFYDSTDDDLQWRNFSSGKNVNISVNCVNAPEDSTCNMLE